MSTVPEVIAALVALGQATLNGDEWSIIDGPANAVTTVRDRVLAIGADEIVNLEDADSFGRSSMAERYMVPVIISVSLPGPDTLAQARTEALGVQEEFLEAVASSVNLGLDGIGVRDAFPSTERRIQQFANENGRSVAVRCGVDIYAQII